MATHIQNIMMKTQSIQLTVLVTMFVCMPPAHAQMKKWVDEDGNIHYGNRSPGGVQSESVQDAPITFSHGSSQVALPAEDRDGNTSAGVNQPNFASPDATGPQVAVLYATSWCGYCKQARAYMAKNGIEYVEFDIEKDPGAQAAYSRYKGRGVPFLVMGAQTLRGFSASSYNRFFR